MPDSRQFGIMFILLPIVLMAFFIITGKNVRKSREAMTSPAGTPYFWHYQPPSRNSPARCELSIALPLPIEFRLDREGRMQQLARTLGFASVFQTGDADFDARVYIDSDDEQFLNSLRDSASMRRAVLDLYDSGIASPPLRGFCVSSREWRCGRPTKARWTPCSRT
jgi:hypothetical protein